MSDLNTLSDGDDFAAFEAAIGTTSEPVNEVEAEQSDETVTDTTDESATETKDEAAESEPEKPKKQTFQERMNEKTRLQREAERERDALRAELELLKQMQSGQVDGDDEGEPQQTDIDAIVERKIKERDEAARAKERDQKWIDAMAKAAEAKDDYFEAVVEGATNATWLCTAEMADAIKDSDNGAEIAYHLAKNPEMSRSISAMPVLSQVREIGKLDALLSAKQEPQPQKQAVTKAPVPAPTVKATGGNFKISPDTDDFAAFEKQYRVR